MSFCQKDLFRRLKTSRELVRSIFLYIYPQFVSVLTKSKRYFQVLKYLCLCLKKSYTQFYNGGQFNLQILNIIFDAKSLRTHHSILWVFFKENFMSLQSYLDLTLILGGESTRIIDFCEKC